MSLGFATVSGGVNHTYWPHVVNLFNATIAPLYGDQQAALDKIAKGVDRVCELLMNGGTPLGILVYKKEPVQEFAQHGAKNALEIKTLCLINAGNNSGRGLGSELVKRIEEIAKNSCFDSVAVTVSEEKQEVLGFFAKKGFIRAYVMNNEHLKKPEYLLVKQLKIDSISS